MSDPLVKIWLVEGCNGQTWCGLNKPGQSNIVTDKNDAIQFARKVDAERFIEGFGMGWWLFSAVGYWFRHDGLVPDHPEPQRPVADDATSRLFHEYLCRLVGCIDIAWLRIELQKALERRTPT